MIDRHLERLEAFLVHAEKARKSREKGMSKTYLAEAPDGKIYSRTSTRPLTFGIAHLRIQAGKPTWIINSFSSGTRATAEKRMKSLSRRYQGKWALVEARLSQNG